MSDLKGPEQNNPPIPREFSLGEEFPVFREAKQRDNHILHSDLIIKISDDLKFPVAFSVSRRVVDSREKINAFTPSNPGAGYQVDERDLDIAQRKEKAKMLKGIQVQRGVAPLVFEANSYANMMREYSLVSRDGRFHVFSPELAELFRRLRLEVSFPSNADEVNPEEDNYRPSSRYQSAPSETSIQIGHLFFSEYYPADLGPLATDNTIPVDKQELHKGLFLDLPDNKKYLESINVKFFFEGEEDHPQEVMEQPDVPSPSIGTGGFIRSKKDRSE